MCLRIMRKIVQGIALIWFVVAAASVSAEQENSTKITEAITVSDAYVYLPMPGKTTTAAFFTIHNNTAKAVTLIGISADLAERVELHSHTHEDGMMKMRREENVLVPANSELVFESGAWHVMLFGVASSLQSGTQLPLVLNFSDGSHLSVTAHVKSRFDSAHH